MDRDWWKRYLPDVERSFTGSLICPLRDVAGVEFASFAHSENSGAGAIALAHHWGASKIIMLGYDVAYSDGVRHWHGDHPKGLGNAGSISKWPAQFERLSRRLSNCDIVNCSRETALTCWPERPLEEVLCEQ